MTYRIRPQHHKYGHEIWVSHLIWSFRTWASTCSLLFLDRQATPQLESTEATFTISAFCLYQSFSSLKQKKKKLQRSDVYLAEIDFQTTGIQRWPSSRALLHISVLQHKKPISKPSWSWNKMTWTLLVISTMQEL